MLKHGFNLPLLEDRKNYLERSFPSWLNTSKSKFRHHKDHYIFTHLSRTYFKLTFLIIIFCCFSVINDWLEGTKPESLYVNFQSVVDFYLPFTLVLFPYYFALYARNIDIDEYSLFINRETNKPAGKAFMMIIVTFLVWPVIHNLIEPSYIYWLFDRDAAFWSQYHNSLGFLVVAACVLLFFYPLAALAGFLFSAIIYQFLLKLRVTKQV